MRRRVSAALDSLQLALSNPDLRRVQIAWAGYQFAEWTLALSLAVYAFEVGGASAVGVAALVRLFPAALVAPAAGLLGDRRSRRSVLMGSAAIRATAAALAAGAIAADLPAGVVYALAGLFMVAACAYQPAQSALFPSLARTPQELAAANVSLSVMDNIGFLAGAGATGIVLAVASPAVGVSLAAAAAALSVLMLVRVPPDPAPAYEDLPDAEGLRRQITMGAQAIAADRGMRLLTGTTAALAFYVGLFDVLLVVVVLDLLQVDSGLVGALQAGWGVGAIIGSAALLAVVGRGMLSAGLLRGALVIGVATALIGVAANVWVSFAALLAIGVGYTFVEVTNRTLLQRLASDEVLGRVFGLQETLRLGGMALGSIAAPALVFALGIEGALAATGALLPALVLARLGAFRAFEALAPVPQRQYELLRGDSIFAALPIATLERLARSLASVSVAAGDVVFEQGATGDRYYVIDSGSVRIEANGVVLREEGPGEGFGEIAMLRDMPRTATVGALEDTRLFALDRDSFLTAVAGHRRTGHSADRVADERLANDPPKLVVEGGK